MTTAERPYHTEEKNKKEDKISQEVVLKKQTVELEKSSCCLIRKRKGNKK
jgi:hypothetical protein